MMSIVSRTTERSVPHSPIKKSVSPFFQTISLSSTTTLFSFSLSIFILLKQVSTLLSVEVDWNTNTLVGRMFEARLTQGNALKLIIDAMKDLVQDANFECSDSEISVQVVFDERM